MRSSASRGDEFSQLVHRILVLEKRRPIRAVAAALGMEYSNFHARVIGRTHFKADEIGPLIREVPDPRLCDYLLCETPFMAVPRPAPATTKGENALHAALHLAGETLAALGRIGNALADGQLEPDEYSELTAHVNEAERALCSLRTSQIALAPHPSGRDDAAATPGEPGH